MEEEDDLAAKKNKGKYKLMHKILSREQNFQRQQDARSNSAQWAQLAT